MIGSKTYSVANLSSVDAAVSRFPRLYCLLAGLLAAGFVVQTEGGMQVFLGLLAIVLIALVFLGKDTHHLMVTGSGGEDKAYSTNNKREFTAMLEAMRVAIVERG